MYKGLSNKGGVTDKKDTVIDNNIRQAWNDYTSWLDKKGMKGSPELDKGDTSGKMIDQYRKENPDTLISRDMIVPIQNEFKNYRQWSLDRIKNGEAAFGDGVTENNFMRGLSNPDGVAGQLTTRYNFPLSYMKTFDANDKLDEVENKGFATIKP